MPIDPAFREMLDALSSSAKGSHACAAGLEKIVDAQDRVEQTMRDFKETLDDVRAELKLMNELEERTDQFRREALTTAGNFVERATKALLSRPALAVYALLAYTLLSIGNVDQQIRDTLLHLVVPSAPDSKPLPPESGE